MSAGERAARNTAVRVAAEIVAKVASLALFAVLARETGVEGLGAFVFAFAFLQLAMVPVELGYDRWLVRRIAEDRAGGSERLLADVLAIKVVTAVPVALLTVAALALLGYGDTARETTYALAGGVLFESLARSIFAVFTAHERGELLAVSLVAQRIANAGLGIAALAAGYGVVTVAAAYTLGGLLGLVVAWALLARRIGGVTLRPRGGWRELSRASLPFGIQDIFSVALFRLDAVILSLIATQAAVGLYGAAWRLFEATFFVSIALSGAFSAMYTYLGPDTTPDLRSVFRRSVKLALASLVPIAVVFGVLAGPVVRAVFGDELGAAADPLRILAPCVVLLGVVTLAVAVWVARVDPKPMVRVTAAMAVLNVVLCVVLIPPLEEVGAAWAMLATEVAYCVLSLAMAARVVNGLAWASTLGGPLAAGAAMAAVAVALDGSFALALAASAIAYVAVLALVERRFSRADFDCAAGVLRRWTTPRTAS